MLAETARSGEVRAALPPVIVVGSINRDYILRIDRRPQPGETIGNALLELSDGGKGANQAVAVAAAGTSVRASLQAWATMRTSTAPRPGSRQRWGSDCLGDRLA